MNQKCALLFARIHDWTQTDAPEVEPTAVWEAGGVKQVNRGNLPQPPNSHSQTLARVAWAWKRLECGYS